MEIEKEIFDNVEDALPDEFAHLSVEGIAQRARLLENELRVLRDETQRLTIEQGGLKEKIKENKVRTGAHAMQVWKSHARPCTLCSGLYTRATCLSFDLHPCACVLSSRAGENQAQQPAAIPGGQCRRGAGRQAR